MIAKISGSANKRAHEAWQQRFNHVKAANAWLGIARERPEQRALCEILYTWMNAYADADAEAEKAFSDLASNEAEP